MQRKIRIAVVEFASFSCNSIGMCAVFVLEKTNHIVSIQAEAQLTKRCLRFNFCSCMHAS